MLKKLLRSSKQKLEDCLDLPDDVFLRHNARAKRLILRQDRIKGTFTLTYPNYCTPIMISRFLERQEDWINQKRAAHTPSIRITDGLTMPFLNDEVVICFKGGSSRKQSQLKEGRLFVYGDEALIGSRVIRFYKKQARSIFTDKAAYFADKADKNFNSIRITDTKSCWGSCTSAGVLSLSWRLLLAPEYVCDYVIAHEVAHLHHMDHSKEFWALCETLEPRTKKAKRWLKSTGHVLHQWQAN